MTALSVNLNKLALLRNQRDIGYPDLLEHAKIILEAGAHGLTVHPRPDERHIRRTDIPTLSGFIADYNETHNKTIEFNIEGYPTDEFMELISMNDCHQVTLVPDAPNQRTSDHGWDINTHQEMLKDVIKTLKSAKRRVALFVDPVPEIILAAAEVGADRIELYTGPYATGDTPLENYIHSAQCALENGLEINAGHDLCLDNLGKFIAHIPDCAETSIGHAITADALKMGWHGAVTAYLSALDFGQRNAKNPLNAQTRTPQQKA